MADAITKVMNLKEARAAVKKINATFGDLRGMIEDFHDRQGWVALGYSFWEECVEKEFQMSKQHAFRLITAAKIEREITEKESPRVTPGKQIPERQLRPLAALPEGDRAAAFQEATETAAANNAPLTAAIVQETVKSKLEEGKRFKTGDPVDIYDPQTGEWQPGRCMGYQGNRVGYLLDGQTVGSKCFDTVIAIRPRENSINSDSSLLPQDVITPSDEPPAVTTKALVRKARETRERVADDFPEDQGDVDWDEACYAVKLDLATWQKLLAVSEHLGTTPEEFVKQKVEVAFLKMGTYVEEAA